MLSRSLSAAFGASALALALLTGASAPPLEAAPPDSLPPGGASEGIVTAGLALSDDPDCMFELVGVESPPGRGAAGKWCTHGPDAAPPSVDDVRTASTEPSPTFRIAEASAEFACHGDGVAGRRVQAVYAVAPDREDRYAEMAPTIRSIVAGVQDDFRESSRVHDPDGDPLLPRFVHSAPSNDGSCTPTVEKVEFPSRSDDDTFSDTIEALQGLGYTAKDRNYLVFTDANLYCGIGTLYADDRPQAADNLNDGRRQAAGYARVDEGCWAYGATHELVHNLGGVQNSAPHATGGFHCNDDYDVMCYDDRGPESSLFVAAQCSDRSVWEDRLDCNGDDYFHPDPRSGSYLSSHWNVARSSWLFPASEASGDATPPKLTVSSPVDGDRSGTTIDVLGSATDANPGVTVQIAVDGVVQARPPLDSVGRFGARVSADAGTRTVSVRATDAAGNRSGIARTVTVESADSTSEPDPTVEGDTVLFLDTVGHVFESEIDRLASAGITNGCNAAGDEFCPGETVTREQMAAFIVRARGWARVTGVDTFVDDDGRPFEVDIETLVANDVTRGCDATGTSFCPTSPVTRGEMAAFLVRARFA